MSKTKKYEKCNEKTNHKELNAIGFRCHKLKGHEGVHTSTIMNPDGPGWCHLKWSNHEQFIECPYNWGDDDAEAGTHEGCADCVGRDECIDGRT